MKKINPLHQMEMEEILGGIINFKSLNARIKISSCLEQTDPVECSKTILSGIKTVPS
jgi:hypothetical protein